ncbi:MAG: RNA polymerase sigma factor [Candidatus Pacearchaeota archaeon]|nr:RNA polymerase sigma factor [Candidatus Pacearchaeota archaeon]
MNLNKSANLAEFRDIVRTYRGYVYTITYRMLGNTADAEDAAQETFIKVFRKLSKYNDAYEIKTWISAIAVNTARDFFRKNKHAKISGTEEEIDQNVSDHEEPTRIQNRLDVTKMLSCLDIRQRSVVILFYMEQFSIKEISAILKKSENLIKVWLHRARKTLARQYGESVI